MSSNDVMEDVQAKRRRLVIGSDCASDCQRQASDDRSALIAGWLKGEPSERGN